MSGPRASVVPSDWETAGTDLAARMKALADLYRERGDLTNEDNVAADIESVLKHQWDPREARR